MAGENVKLYFTKHEEWQVNGNFLCEFCDQKFAKGTSSTRLRAHLTGEPRAGAKSCPSVPQDVKDSLQSNKRQRTRTSASVGVQLGQQIESSSTFQPNTLQATYSMGMVAETTQANESGNKSETSSNPHQIESGANNHYIPSFSPEVNNDFGNIGQHNQLGYDEIDELRYMKSTPPNESGSVESLLLRNVTNFQVGETSEGVIGWTTQPVERGSTHQPDPLTTTDLMLPNESATRASWLTDETDQHGVVDVEIVQQEFQTVEANHEGEGSAFRTKRLMGEVFVRNEGKIWSLLMDDQVLRVGIYGMGGVGKTTLMRHIQTRLKGQSSFEVYWVTVSQDFSIWKLQNLIAKKIGFNFSENEDEVERAEELTQSLKAKGKCVLILDDLWNCFNIDEVGIPVQINACKLVLTTRDLKVCRQMLCSEENMILVQPLLEEQSWNMFAQELGNYSIEVEELAKAVCRECGGLPLGIRVLSRTMRGICHVHTWRNALEELKESKISKGHEMREKVFSVLKFSYLRLNDPALQECLSYCALFPEDYKIRRGDVLNLMIVEGIIDEKKTRQAELDKGDTLLDTLQNACLLEGDDKIVWMHDLIRDMMILELRERSNTLVEAGLQLKELPDVENWREDLVRVSLIGNELGVIPYGHTRRCPNLSTLLLRDNRQLKRIANSFFKQFQKLKVLDLSHCLRIKELPKSISNLVNLTALLLSGCHSLIYVPSLVKLEKLKVLDLCNCERLKEMPEGMKFLPKLNYLDLSVAGEVERESEISKFVGREVGELRMLKIFYCDFRNLIEFEECVESQERSQQSLSHYNFYIGRRQHFERKTTLKSVYIGKFSFIDPLRLPTDIEALCLQYCGSTFYKRLFPPSILSRLINLQEIGVHFWNDIEEIFAVKEDNINTALVQFLFSYSLSNHSLLNLKVIIIWGCHKLRKLFPPSLLPNLHNLQKITVRYCHAMEEIFSTDEEDGQELSFGQSINNNHYPPNPASTSTVSTGLNLPKLTKLDLQFLRELRSIYKGAINCHSLREIELDQCPKLERITLPLPQPSLRRIRVYPKKWWESVQWGSANDKIHLEPLCEFTMFCV